jgi:2-polyprenyl-3-methyl-5-hydroxy-6-metoxy-1,4-benzoquinol methylase
MSDRTVYDEVRYSNYPYAQTHPDRVATVAELHGVAAPDPRAARVLELGCGAGGNLLAMAIATPGISAVGVDLAGEVIEEGRAAASEIGLDNVELRQGDVSALTQGQLGEFDYVISHGVYAWVPEPVRDDLLAAVESHLAADGLAYVSYNTNPGGYLRRALREVGLWFARGESSPAARAARAQELFRFVYDHRAGTDDWWGGLLETVAEPLAIGPVYRLVHDDLAEAWNPVWFADFTAHAARHRLAYVGEADLGNLLRGRVPGPVEPALRELVGDDRIAYEQVYDVLRGMFFRQSILCRDSRVPAAEPSGAALRALHFAVRPAEAGEAPAGLLGDAVAILRSREPGTVGFDELRAALAADPDALGDALLEGFNAELVMPHRVPLRVPPVDELQRPAASRLARWQAAKGFEDMTSLAYTSVRMEEPAARLLLTLLDGTRDRATVRAEFADRTGVRLSPEDLEANLEQLARMFLLEPPAA